MPRAYLKMHPAAFSSSFLFRFQELIYNNLGFLRHRPKEKEKPQSYIYIYLYILGREESRISGMEVSVLSVRHGVVRGPGLGGLGVV